MNRPYYSEYVRHAMRFYSKNLQLSHFKSEANRQNWFACNTVFQGYSQRDKDILLTVYSDVDMFPHNVYKVADRYNVKHTVIWDLIKNFEYKVAHNRGLI